MTVRRFDLVIVGGGPAGLAAAVAGAGRGLGAVVLERGTPPLDKACGEGILPGGVRWLERAGVDVPGLGGAPIAGVRYVAGARVAAARFPGRPGLGLPRTTLVAALRCRARALGVTLLDRTPVRVFREAREGVVVETDGGPVGGRILVGADGLSSRVRAEAGLGREPRRRPLRRYGVRRHVRLAGDDGPGDHVEVHWADAAEAYVTPVGDGVVGVAILFEGKGTFDALLPRFPALAARIADAAPLGPDRGAGPLERAVAARARGRVALVGDAAGYVDAITGEGLTVAFRQASALAEVVASGAALERYDAPARRASRDVDRLTRLLLRVTRRPAMRPRLVGLLGRHPGLFERALGVLAGE